MNPKIAEECLQEFDGCDSDDPGSVESPYVLVFGLEHGAAPHAPADDSGTQESAQDPNYGIDWQVRQRFNLNLIKMLTVLNGQPSTHWREFATREQPFVKGACGYFKGNLYPYACKTTAEWPAEAEHEVGATKNEYIAWCDAHRIPVIHGWVNKYQPRLFLGVGISAAHLFSRCVFGTEEPLRETRFTAATGGEKRVLHRVEGWRQLAVVPHLSGRSADCLRSHDQIERAGMLLRQALALP